MYIQTHEMCLILFLLMSAFWNVLRALQNHMMTLFNSAQHMELLNLEIHAILKVPTQKAIKDVKRKLYRAVANVNILEGIRFYVSFACSFAFGELKLMEGSAKIISLIARDENQHLAITQNILNKWREGDDPEMKQIMQRKKKSGFIRCLIVL
jgi:ribonucleotide reductase beta subunit family protein with ferritin-like domain